MQIFISLNAAPKVKDVTKYEWYKFVGKRTVHLYNHHKVFDLDIEEGEVFGVRSGRNFAYLVPREDLTLEFRLTFKEIDAIFKRCVGFKGRINKKTVTAGVRGKDGRTPVADTGSPSSPAGSRVGVHGSGLREDPELTRFIRGLPFVAGIKKALHVRAERAFGKEVYHFYDVTNALNSYRRKYGLKKPEKGNFFNDLEQLVEKSSNNDIDAEVGIVKFNGRMRTILACLIVED